ncbi:hypothetical protein G7Y89_g10640 [Cudoniella acicularis]|uniref:Uncharacterized protein n=1 Tax=Cudoniella acicularis TaxID=354080 RepID=A0A8H4VZ11_9HELO|nr:hypothetical protein G7Y89_g10640 [Cudoniella acicularis]
MADSIDQPSHGAPPVPPKHTSSILSRDVVNFNVQVSMSRSSSPEKGVKSQLVTTYPVPDHKLGESADSGGLLDASSQDWHLRFINAKKSWELCEEELRSKIDELKAGNDNRPPSEAYHELQSKLEVERRLREKAEDDLRQRSIEVEETRKRWKQAARELDKCRSQSQGFYQVTDHYLIELTTQLRYNIRSFAIQYFGGELRKKPNCKRTDYWKLFMESTTSKTIAPETYLLSKIKCPSIIQAFLWRFLVSKIFDNFRWAGDASLSFWELCRFLRPKWQVDRSSDHSRNPETERKFQVWSATTTALLFDSMDTEGGSEEYKDFLVSNIRETIDPYLRSRDSDYPQELLRILDNAIALDKEISRQVARVEWVFPGTKEKIMYISASMELERGEKSPKPDQEVLLTISPGLQKRGKSTGEDFKAENLLVPAEVSWY